MITMRVWMLLLVVFLAIINSSSGAGQKAWFRCLRPSAENRTVELYVDRDDRGPDIKYLIGRRENGRTCSYIYERPLKIRVTYSRLIKRFGYHASSAIYHDTCGVTDLGHNNYKISLLTAGVGKMVTTYDRRYTFMCHFTEPMPSRARYELSSFMKVISDVRASTEEGKAVPIVSPPRMDIIGKNGTKKEVITPGEPVRLRISIKVGEGELVATGFRVDRCQAGFEYESLDLIKNGCSVPIRGVIAANEGFVKNSEMSTGDLFVSDGPWFHSFRLIKNDIKFGCSLQLCYGRNSTKCDKSCGGGVTTGAPVSRHFTETATLLTTTAMNLIDVNSRDTAAVGVPVRRCDSEAFIKCSKAFRLRASLFLTEETKANKFPKTCKAIEDFAVCASPAIKGCYEVNQKAVKATVNEYREAPFNCQFGQIF